VVFVRFREVHVSPALHLNAEGTGMAFGHCKLRFWLFRILFLGGFLLPPLVGLVEGRTGNLVTLRGEVDNVPVGRDLTIELLVPKSDFVPNRTTPTSSGQFMFESIRPGEYRASVVDTLYQQVLYSASARITGAEDLAIRLPKQGTEEPSSGTVSVRELQQRIPSKARKAYGRALAEFRKGNTGKAIADLEKAIQIDPSFADAHNDLGGCYAKLGQADKAVVEFAEASSLDPDSAVMMYNFALTLVGLKRFPEAEDAARAALKLAPSLAQAHFVLGYSLYQQRRFGQEAVDNLVWAGRQVPKALLIAAEVLVRQGRQSEAARQLKRYLASPETGPDRERAQSWLKRLGQ
jgi:Tfp pilus assembly protein PilF